VPEALAYVEQKTGICLLPATSVTGWPGITVKPLSTHVLMRRCGVFIREDNRSPILQKLLEVSLRHAEGAHMKRGPISVTLPIVAREESRKVKGVS
jgi:hypothetical protein